MQRPATVLLTSLLAGLLGTGCPEKRVEKEEPAAETALDKSGSRDKPVAEDERVEEGEEPGEEAKDEGKPARRKLPEKKDPAPEEKDPGGW
jgi:hypothetical protein